MPRANPPSEDRFRALLGSHGLRVTAHRITILEELARLRVPVSHPELSERLAHSGLDRATVYRNLLTLTESGVLVKTQLGDGVWRFEWPRGKTPGHDAHPHFVCTDCGDISCLPEGSVTVQSRAVAQRVAEVQLRGVCSACHAGPS